MSKVIKDYLPFVIIVGLLAFIFVNRCSDYDSGETRTVKTDSTSSVTKDSTEVDWNWVDRTLSSPDTVVKEVPVPVPIKTEATDSVSTRTYNQTYRDSVIHARWTTRVAGKLISQEFEYVPQVQRVGIKTVTKWRTRVNTFTKTVRVKEKISGHLTAGGMVGMFPEHTFIAPEIGWVSPRGDVFEVAYDPWSQGVVVSGDIKISFRGILPF